MIKLKFTKKTFLWSSSRKNKICGICGSQINEIDAAKGVDKYLPHLLDMKDLEW